MKNNLYNNMLLFLAFVSLCGFTNDHPVDECNHNKDEMVVVMRFEIKVKPYKVSLLKQSFDECKKVVLEREPGCMDYSMFQSYNDSTIFCITETWATKADHNAHMQLDHTIKHLEETKGIHDPSFKSNSNYMYWVCPDVNK